MHFEDIDIRVFVFQLNPQLVKRIFNNVIRHLERRLLFKKNLVAARNLIYGICEPLKSPNQSCKSQDQSNPRSIKSQNIMEVVILSPPFSIPFNCEALLCLVFLWPP